MLHRPKQSREACYSQPPVCAFQSQEERNFGRASPAPCASSRHTSTGCKKCEPDKDCSTDPCHLYNEALSVPLPKRRGCQTGRNCTGVFLTIKRLRQRVDTAERALVAATKELKKTMVCQLLDSAYAVVLSRGLYPPPPAHLPDTLGALGLPRKTAKILKRLAQILSSPTVVFDTPAILETYENIKNLSALFNNMVRIVTHKPSLRKSKYKCPDCGRNVLVLVAREYYWCKGCDWTYHREQLVGRRGVITKPDKRRPSSHSRFSGARESPKA
jgi:hypothetical protein